MESILRKVENAALKKQVVDVKSGDTVRVHQKTTVVSFPFRQVTFEPTACARNVHSRRYITEKQQANDRSASFSINGR
jgi:hypothetical protein